MSEAGPRLVRLTDPMAAVKAVGGSGRRIVTFIGFSGSGYEDPAWVGRLLDGILEKLTPASVIVCAGATADGIGAVYPLAKARGFETIGIVSSLADAEHVRLPDAVDTVYVVEDDSWGGCRPDGTLSPTSEAMVAAADEIIVIGGGDVARDEFRAAMAADKQVRYEPADMNHDAAFEKARQKGEAAPQDFKGPLHAMIPALCDQLREQLVARPSVGAAKTAASLLLALRDLLEFDGLCALADVVCRLLPDDAKSRRLYAQGLIEKGRLTAAVDMLEAAKHRYGAENPQYAEFEGLLGRAYKQLFMDTADQQGVWRRGFIERSFKEYSGPYTRDPKRNFWHGINLGALSHAASLHNITLAGPTAREYTSELLVHLDGVDPGQRDPWWYATKAEAHAARGEWKESERALRVYIEDQSTTSFMLAGTLRQLRDLWAIQRETPGARLLQMLEAMLIARPASRAVPLKMGSPHLRDMRALEPANDAQLQSMEGARDRETIEWYRKGLKRAASVASVKERMGLRFGTGFAVRAEHFGIAPGNEILLLTNFHVLNGAGRRERRDFGNVEVVFEAAAEKALPFAVRGVVTESNSDNGLDYALFRLDGQTDRLEPVDLTPYDIPPSSINKLRVFIIGYPLGDVMQFSLQNNLLLDHECAPAGKPPNPSRRRVQYSASTEEGNSGSPVFDDKWCCIALHHAGGKRNPRTDRYGIAKLNGQSTSWEANEGIWIGSIVEDVKLKNLKLT